MISYQTQLAAYIYLHAASAGGALAQSQIATNNNQWQRQ